VVAGGVEGIVFSPRNFIPPEIPVLGSAEPLQVDELVVVVVLIVVLMLVLRGEPNC
jgi:hypothetical protein